MQKFSNVTMVAFRVFSLIFDRCIVWVLLIHIQRFNYLAVGGWEIFYCENACSTSMRTYVKISITHLEEPLVSALGRQRQHIPGDLLASQASQIDETPFAV